MQPELGKSIESSELVEKATSYTPNASSETGVENTESLKTHKENTDTPTGAQSNE
jgi:hypothetical protein